MIQSKLPDVGTTIFTGVETEFANVREFPNITGDHFTFEATVFKPPVSALLQRSRNQGLPIK